jgi:hypothetical protein
MFAPASMGRDGRSPTIALAIRPGNPVPKIDSRLQDSVWKWRSIHALKPSSNPTRGRRRKIFPSSNFGRDDEGLPSFQMGKLRIPALLAAHPTIHQGLRTACPTQMPDLRSVGEQHIPCRQPQHRLLRRTGNERSRFGQSQPPVLRVAPRITANIAVVSLCKRHTKNLSISRGRPCRRTSPRT